MKKESYVGCQATRVQTVTVRIIYDHLNNKSRVNPETNSSFPNFVTFQTWYSSVDVAPNRQILDTPVRTFLC